MRVCSIEEVVDTLDPTDVVRREPALWSVECSTVVFSLFSTFGQPMYLVASEGYCISCGKPFRADFLGSCQGFWPTALNTHLKRDCRYYPPSVERFSRVL